MVWIQIQNKLKLKKNSSTTEIDFWLHYHYNLALSFITWGFMWETQFENESLTDWLSVLSN